MSSESMQSLLVLIIVAAAAVFVGMRWYRTLATARRKNDSGCGGGCGCSKD